MEEKRKHQRSLCYLKAVKKETEEHIGHVGDIHYEGLNIVSENEIPLHDDLTICLETLEDEFRISLVIKGVWNQMNDEPKHYITGCQIIDPSQEAIEAINKLIETLKNGGRRPFKYSPYMRTETGLA